MTHGNFSIFDRSSLKSVPRHTHGLFGLTVQLYSPETMETSTNMKIVEKNIFVVI